MSRRPVKLYSEQDAIGLLEHLGERWPKTLTLYSNSGTLEILRTEDYRRDPVTAKAIGLITGIPNDGGDRT